MTESMNILAVSDYGVYAMFAAQTLVSIGMGFGIWKLTQTTSRLDRSEDQRRDDIKAMSVQLHQTTERLVDERFRAMSHSVNNHVQAFTTTLDVSTRRLTEAEKKIGEIGGIGPQAEIKLVKEVSTLRTELATKRELAEVRESIKELTRSLNDLGRETINLDDMRKLLKEVKAS